MSKTILLFFALIASFAAIAQSPVTGTIVDEKNNPVPYASVSIKNSKAGTRADENGNFKIPVSTGQTLIVSAINFTPQEVEVTSTSALTVQLKSADQTLNEVVVTALGIKREKRSLGYAAQTVGSDQLNKSGSGNPLSELNGKVAGLSVINSSGDPGSGTYIRLRGVTSITGDNQPLIVVDGVPLDNGINNFEADNGAGFSASGASGNAIGGSTATNRGLDINPDDIESITLLKGPAATALYGIQAASGALIITTKKGNPGQHGLSVEFNSSFTIDKVSQLPALQNQFGQGDQGVYQDPSSQQPYSWGAKIDTLYWNGDNTYPWDKHGAIVGKSDPSAKIPVTPYNTYNFFVNGFTYNNNIALSGNNDKSSFRLSLGNLTQTGIIPKSKYNKTAFSLSGQSKLTNRLTASGGVTYTNSVNNKVLQGSQQSGVMLGLTRTSPTFDNSNGLPDPANNPAAYQFPDGTQRNYRGGFGYDNPYWTVNKNPVTSNVDRVFGYGQANYQMLNWLSLSYRLGGDIYTQSDKDAYDVNSRVFPLGAIYLIDYVNQQFNSDFTVNIGNPSATKNINWSLLLGHNYFTLNNDTRFANGNGLVVPGFLDISNASTYISTESEVRKRTMAFYADAELNYKRMLYLSLTGRREESSTLPVQNNTFFYPSASLSWIFTELPALKSNNILSYGKLRASFAQVGKDAPVYGLTTPFTSPASASDGFTNGITFPINGNVGYQISSNVTTIGNPDIKPENTYSYEGGADLGFLKNRINLSATGYYSKSVGVIILASVPFSTGFAAELLNAATITNKGLELSLNTTPVKSSSHGLNWDLNFNWSTNKNLVVKLAPGIDNLFIGGFGQGEVGVYAIAGQPFGMLYGKTTPHSDLNNLNSPLLIDDEKTDAAGNINPSYGQPIAGGVGPNLIIGNTNPKWIGSVINNLSYQNFTLSFQVDVRAGGDIHNGTRGALAARGLAEETANRGTPTVFQGLLGHLNADGQVVHYDKDGVTELPGPGTSNTIQSAYDENYWQNAGNSAFDGQEVDVEKSSFVKLRQASLSYQFPKNLFRKAWYNSLSLTVFANNFILWTKYDGVDPETSLLGPSNGQGLDFFNNPSTHSYGIRLNLGL